MKGDIFPKIEITCDTTGKRPSRDEIFMAIAKIYAMRGTCGRAKVGCIITSPEHRIISSGYNGTLIGAPHCSERNCDLTQKCQHSVHAETNAIAFAARAGLSLLNSVLYCTTAPCKTCAQLIVQSGIIRVVYLYDYTDNAGIELLEQNGLQVNKHE